MDLKSNVKASGRKDTLGMKHCGQLQRVAIGQPDGSVKQFASNRLISAQNVKLRFEKFAITGFLLSMLA